MLPYVVYWFILFILFILWFLGLFWFIVIFELSCLLLWFISEGFSELHKTANSFSSYE